MRDPRPRTRFSLELDRTIAISATLTRQACNSNNSKANFPMNLNVTNPFDQQPVCSIPYDTDADIERALTQAQQAFQQWRQLSVSQRVVIVGRAIDSFSEQADVVARDITLQMGKPLKQARGEFDGMIDRARVMLGLAEANLAPEVLTEKPGLHRRVEHVPHGIVLNIAAWNYPLFIPINVIVPALLAGNTVLLKHSAKTPLTGRHLANAFGNLEIQNLVTHLVLGHEQTGKLIADPRIGYVGFTGSVEGGREIQRHVSGRFIDCGLELGGNDPAYVAEDADLDFAVENIVDGACYNAGQSCCAVERVYVHQSLYNRFLEKALLAIQQYRLGDPLDDQTTMGPLASRGAIDALQSQVDDAVNRGARLLIGGKCLSESEGNFYEPTLLADVPADAHVMQEESFGPLLPVASVADDDEAISRMNDTRFGLTASVWTEDAERAERFASQLQAGTVYQNRCDFLDPELPWTGFRDSGKGSTLSRWGFFHLTKRKSIHFRSHAPVNG
jgi:acyl-CoA reductase-like NAD-dependent aldehyde dehydrogenase